MFIVDEWFFPMYAITPRPGTVRAQVWHGAGAFKKFGYSVLDKSFGADEDMVRLVPIHSNYDVCLVSSTAATPSYMDAFRLPRERFTSFLGVPRTDLFFDAARRARATEAVRQRYGLRHDAKVLLYAPTFRGDHPSAARYQDDLDLRVMRDALVESWVLLIRLHPFVRRPARLPDELVGFVVDVSDWPDMNELMLVADLLVTDYSSAIFEYALLERPMAFFAPDLDAYEHERGFYFDYRTAFRARCSTPARTWPRTSVPATSTSSAYARSPARGSTSPTATRPSASSTGSCSPPCGAIPCGSRRKCRPRIA